MSGYYVWTRYSNFLHTMTLIRAITSAITRSATSQVKLRVSAGAFYSLCTIRYDRRV